MGCALCRFVIDPITWWEAGGKRSLDLAGFTKLLLMSGMYPDSFVVDNDYKRIETTGRRALTKKVAISICCVYEMSLLCCKMSLGVAVCFCAERCAERKLPRREIFSYQNEWVCLYR